VSAALVLQLLAAAALGAGLGYLLLARRHSALIVAAARAAVQDAQHAMQTQLIEGRERLIARDAEVQQLRLDLERSHATLEQLRVDLMSAREQAARSDSELKEAAQRIAEQRSFFEVARETLNTQFKTLASEILEEKGRHLSELHRGELGLVLGPLSEKLAAFQNKVEEVYVTEGQHRFNLAQEVHKLQAASSRLADEATNLTRALKGESKTRGNWGEVMLEAVLERSGLVKGREYEVQMTLATEDGKSYPDVVVRLPDNKHIVIDSKVSLVAYDQYYACDTDAERELALRQHIASMRRHFTELGKKNYQGNEVLNTPDFVAMFVPIEPAFNLAAGADAALIFDAFDRKVVLVTPGTLLAMLSTVATLWRREQQSSNALEIARKAGEMYDKFADVMKEFNDVGDRLASASKAFDSAKRRLSEGPGNVVKRLHDLQKMGAKASKSLPDDMLARALIGADAAEPTLEGTLPQPDLLQRLEGAAPANEADAA
jgi:DNA recombination protein RmuC